MARLHWGTGDKEDGCVTVREELTATGRNGAGVYLAVTARYWGGPYIDLYDADGGLETFGGPFHALNVWDYVADKPEIRHTVPSVRRVVRQWLAEQARDELGR